MKIVAALLFSLTAFAAKAQTTYSITKDTSVKLEAKTYFDTAEVQPHFKGDLGQYLVKNVRIPKGVKPTGKITTQFWIDTVGKISYVEIADQGKGRPASTPLEKELVRVIKGMPRWQPGTYKGKKVTVRYSMPIVF